MEEQCCDIPMEGQCCGIPMEERCCDISLGKQCCNIAMEDQFNDIHMEEDDVIFVWRSSAIICLCIMAYIISFDVWCAVFELPPDTSILPRRWSFRFLFCYMELLSGQCSKSSAIFKYRTVHTVYSDKDKRSCQMNNFSDTFC